jgi:hypothetical protein
MHVTSAVRSGALEEALPVPVCRFVGARLLHRDRLVDRHAELEDGSSQQVRIGVGEKGQPPAALPERPKRGGNLREGRP